MFATFRRHGLRVWALLTAALLFAALCIVHSRHTLSAAHDAGFAVAPQYKALRGSQDRPRQVLNADGQFITLDRTGRFLVNSTTNRPVFITGDSAWSLITQLDDSDVELYLSDRASRGFNYVWCAAADNRYQSNAPRNFYGYPPFDGPDFTDEDASYWKHVDDVIRRAATHGITVALSPGFVGLSSSLGYLASYLNSSDSVLTAYGAFLGDRYKSFPNVIWALGGDVDPQTGVVPRLTALAAGIRSRDHVHLIVAEGQPQSAAADTFSGTSWMDLNWLYFRTANIPGGAAVNYSRSPWLPPFEGEGWYENDHSMTRLQLREQEYWSVLSGAYLGNGGFGNDPLWYFNGGPEARAGEPTWQSQLGSSGSLGQMYFGKLFRSREHWKLVPDVKHVVMTSGYDSRGLLSSAWEFFRSAARHQPYRLGSASSVAARTSDGQTIIVYVPNGNLSAITIDLSEIEDPRGEAKGWWFSPRSGSATLIGAFPTSGRRSFRPPDASDWVLVLDGATANLAAPGAADL